MPIVDPLSELIPIVNPLFELIALALQAMSRVVHIRSHHAPRDAPPYSSNAVSYTHLTLPTIYTV